MSYKTISLSVDAYNKLKVMQLEDESFSEEVMRIASVHKLSDVAGILSNKEAEELEEEVGKIRKKAAVRKWQ